jgi:hypothetical protein
MPTPAEPEITAEDVLDRPLRQQLEVFLDEHRTMLHGCLDGLTEDQARRSLVPSRTTLLGLVKHAVFVEKVWFDEAVTKRTRAEIGIPPSPDASFELDETDTIDTVLAAHREACASSRRMVAALDLDDLVEVSAEADGLAVRRKTCCLAFTLDQPKVCSGCCIR